jgi:hypothetical protein
MSADVGDALLGLCLGSGLGLRGEREDSCVLPFIEPRQQHDLAIRELERIMIGVKRALVDLAKDRNGVAGIGTKLEGGLILDWRLEREFGTRKYADSHRTILRRGESSCAGAEVVCDEFFANFGWACSHTVQTVVAHISSGCPGARDIYLLQIEETFDVTLSDHETPIRTIAGGFAMIGLAQALRLLLEINRTP